MPIEVNLEAIATPAFYLRDRGFSPHILARLGISIQQLDGRAATYGLPPAARDAEVVVIPYDGFDRIRLIGADEERFGGGKYRQPAGRGLELWDPLGCLSAGSDWVLLIEGELNLVAVNEADPDLPVVAVPGQNALKPELAAQLGHLAHVVVWLDLHDPRGLENLDTIRERLHGAGVPAVRHVVDVPARWDAARLLHRAQEQGDLDLWRRYLADRLATATTDDGRPGVVLTPASAIRPERLRWLWQGWLPLRSLAVLAGPPGLGKSTVLGAWVAAQVSRGALPGDRFTQPQHVLVASAEDDRPSIVVPRLMAHDADLERVHRMRVRDADGTGLLTLPDDVGVLAARIERQRRAGAPVGLVIIDPIGAFLGASVDSHRDASTRRALAPLAELAAAHDLVVAVVAHLNKNSSLKLLDRLSGSVAFGGAPRAVSVWVSDPSDPDGDDGPLRVLVDAKANWSGRAPALAARMESATVDLPAEDSTEVGRVRWLGPSDVRSDQLSGTDSGADRVDTEEAIMAALASGPRPSREVKAQVARELHCSYSTVKRAAGRLVERGLLSIEEGGFPRTTTWVLNDGADSGATPSEPTTPGPTAQTRIPGPNGGGSDTQWDQLQELAPLDPHQEDE
jgi:hypothetical protein